MVWGGGYCFAFGRAWAALGYRGTQPAYRCAELLNASLSQGLCPCTLGPKALGAGALHVVCWIREMKWYGWCVAYGMHVV